MCTCMSRYTFNQRSSTDLKIWFEILHVVFFWGGGCLGVFCFFLFLICLLFFLFFGFCFVFWFFWQRWKKYWPHCEISKTSIYVMVWLQTSKARPDKSTKLFSEKENVLMLSLMPCFCEIICSLSTLYLVFSKRQNWCMCQYTLYLWDLSNIQNVW